MPPKKPKAQKAEKKGGDDGKKAGSSKKAKGNQASGGDDAEASGSSKVAHCSFPALQILLHSRWTKRLLIASQVEGSNRYQRKAYHV